ncbi:hypothetical protein ACW5XW_19520 [Aeromonas piscicola]|uniref:hypothetical protein n=1 Tax=Aeromonas piscicola TaxID=600645 RepID=UPI000A9B990A|nr:hypothetical protein [Aeromonas piscicola]
MTIKRPSLFLFFIFLISPTVHAVNVTILPPAQSKFITVEDRDNIYIGALSNGARITGSSNFTTHPDHGGLSYLSDGEDRTIPGAPWGFMYNIEVWEDNPVVNSPYLGLHCWKYQSSCQSSIFEAGNTLIRTDGFRLNTKDRDARLINPRISQGYMNYLNKMPVGNKFTTNINYCWAVTFLSGANCTTVSNIEANNNRWHKKSVTFIKEGHLRLYNSMVSVDIMISNSGEFYVLPGSRDCESSVIAGNQGVACRFLTHELTLASAINIDMLSLTPSIKDSRLASLSQSDFQISTDKNTWYKQGSKMPFSQLNKSNAVYIFMSKNVIKEISKIPPPRRLVNMFSLIVSNELHPGSGFYEIKGSTDVNFTSRQMSVAIREKNGLTHPVKSGTVGRDKLEFEYLITESASVPSESLEVSVRQDMGSPFNKNCTFYPPNNVTQSMAVEVPAKIQFTDRIGSFKNIFAQVYCDGTPLDLRKLGIVETRSSIPWAESDSVAGAIRFYDISLLFDLRPKSVTQTVGGEQWEGEVYQSGTISVKSVWK